MNISPVDYTPDFGTPPTTPPGGSSVPFTASKLDDVQAAVDSGRIPAKEGLMFAQAMKGDPHTWGKDQTKAAPQLKVTPVDYTPDFTGEPAKPAGVVPPIADTPEAIKRGVSYFQAHDMTMQLINAARDGRLKKWLESPWHLKKDLADAPKNIRKGTATLVKEAVKNPVGFIGSTLRGMVESPELFLVGGIEGGLVKRVVMGAAINAGIGAAGSVGVQLQQTGKVDSGQVAQAAAGGMLTGGALGAVGRSGKLEAKPPVPEAMPAPAPDLTLEARNDPQQMHQLLDQHVQDRAAAALQEQGGPAPKTHLVEGHVLGEGTVVPADHPALELPGAKSTLDSAVAKVKAGQKFAMTPEERIQWERLGKGGQQIELARGSKARGAFRDVPRFPEQEPKGTLAQGKVLGDEPVPEAKNFVLPKEETPLDRATAKVKAGRAFAMTDAERIAWNRTQTRTGFGKGQAGSFDPYETGKMLGKATAFAAGSLGALMDGEKYTAKTLDRLPQGKTSFTVDQIDQQLKRSDVTGPERDAFHAILDMYGKDGKISAEDLAKGFKLQSGAFHLTPRDSKELAEHGLDNLGRYTPDATTTMYDLPKGTNVGVDAHSELSHDFKKPDMYGWTRSFQEKGTRHVVEMQLNSNLAKPKEHPDVAYTAQRIPALTKDLAEAQKDLEKAKAINDPWAIDYAQQKVDLAESKLAPLQKKLEEHLNTAKVYSKNYHQRLVQEELARAAGKPVRFATPDTMAKVEGWTKDRSPDLQSIHDRYKREIVPYLKNLGGKEVTDAAGHSWIEVTPQAGAKAKMYGKADVDLLKKLGIAAGGAVAFNYLDPQDGWDAAATGAALALTGAWLAPHLREGLKEDTRLRIDKYTKDYEATNQIAKVRLHGFVRGILKAVPDDSRRVAVTHYLDGEKVDLSPSELKVANSIRGFFDKAAYDLKKNGLMDAAREDYVTHLWDIPQNKGRMGGSITTKSPFTNARTYSTLAEGKAAGLVPKTEDIAAIVHTYGTSTNRAMAGKTFVDTLKGLQGPDGRKLIAPAGEAPRGYEPVNLAQLRGSLVHPDIAPSLRMFESPRLGQPFEGVSEGMQALKRVKVMGSLFHIKTLGEVALTGRSFRKALSLPGQLATFAAGKDAMLQALNEGGMSENVDALIRGGLNFSLEGDTPGVEDIGGSFYDGMSALQGYLDDHAAALGKANKAFTAINHKMDTLTWARVQTGFKFLLGDEKMQELMKNGVEKEKAAEISASYVNTLFGGLNWRRVAEGAHSRWGRDAALALLHPKARSVQQMLLFAPDWTVSTIRQITQAIRRPGSLGEQLKGLVKPTELADLHRQALARSALYYLAVGSAVNEYFSGKPIWDNKNPLRVDLGDGRTMQFSKHLTEPLEWFKQPGQTAAGKLSYAVTEPLNQITGKEYIGGPPMQENRVVHAAKGLLPFPATATSPGAALSGMAGFPVYGHTREQMRELAMKRYENEHSPAALEKRMKKHLQNMENR